MRLRDVDDQKLGPIPILVVQLIEGGNLPPEGRSSVASENEYDRPVCCGYGRQPHLPTVVQLGQGEIGRGIARAQFTGAGMDPQGLKGENDESYRGGDSCHHVGELLGRLAHHAIESGTGDQPDQKERKQGFKQDSLHCDSINQSKGGDYRKESIRASIMRL